MWAFNVESYGTYGSLIPAGNNGAQKLHNKTIRGWKKETEFMRGHTIGRVYVMKDYTQKMCEMSPRQLAKYVMENYIAIL